jgi:RNA polymerase sigma-70 factor (ECF subfamily)
MAVFSGSTLSSGPVWVRIPLQSPTFQGKVMLSTSTSLLQRLRRPDQEQAWARFVDLYTPLLLAWARKAGLSPDDAADHVQEVFAHLVRKLPEFQYDPQKGSFRGWLRMILVNKLRDRMRRQQPVVGQADGAALAGLIDAASSEPLTEQEHNQYLVRRALELMRTEFEATTWQACWEFVANDRPAAEVASQLGITENAVYIAKLRVLRRLRQELTEFLQ